MYSFLISIAALIVGYVLYGRIAERVFGARKDRITPAYEKCDGVDYVPLPTWKVFTIQFLNIAGTGPIFGAIMGAKFGPACYLWIVLGSIFAGAVHDYFSGMLSLRYYGSSLPDILSHYLGGNKVRPYISVFLILFMLLVGTVFVYSPAIILGDMTQIMPTTAGSIMFWVVVIFIYYVVATLLPIDKLIGRVYPVFAVALIFMAAALMVGLLIRWPSIPELWDGLYNRAPSVGVEGQNIFPCLFITVACGAISGFHGTQSPLMARCLKNEKHGRPIFYGAMIMEGMVALVWAAVSSYFFFDGGIQETGATGVQAPSVVTAVAQSWLGTLGGILAILGVVAAPVTSGDTTLRSARLIFSELIRVDQKSYRKRILVALPLFSAAMLLLWFNIADEDGFNVIWRYFGWMNQTLASCTLWAISVWLARHSKYPHWLMSMIPAIFMTSVCITFICVDRTGFGLPQTWTPYIAVATVIVCVVAGFGIVRRNRGIYENSIN